MKKILVVDDEANNLQLLRQVLSEEYQLFFATNGQKALDIASQHLPDLILLDIMMPGMNGYEVCQRLKQDQLTESIPVIFVTAMGDVADETKGFDMGAVDYIHKPLSVPVVRRRVETHLSLIRAQELESSYREAIHMLGVAGHFNDEDTGFHIWRMSAFARAIAEAAGWSKRDAEILEMAAPMHDMGKIGVPDSILKAPRKLASAEWDIMKTHCQMGYEILSVSKSPVFKMAAEIAFSHHERWDGSGYPQSLQGKAIPESARIVAIADVFDALTTQRPYKEPWAIDDAIKEMKGLSGSHFDPELFDLFVTILPQICDIKMRWDRGDPSVVKQTGGAVYCENISVTSG